VLCRGSPHSAWCRYLTAEHSRKARAAVAGFEIGMGLCIVVPVTDSFVGALGRDVAGKDPDLGEGITALVSSRDDRFEEFVHQPAASEVCKACNPFPERGGDASFEM
jgi:hypothetical protein